MGADTAGQVKPPHQLTKANRRYIGSTDEVIERLRQDGYDVSWYAKHKLTERPMDADKCGYFTVYLLEQDWAYTVDHLGERYQQYRKLSKPEPEPCYYCAACKQRMTKEIALAHRGIRQLEGA